MVHTTKNYATSDATSFRVLGRVFSGTIEAGQEVGSVYFAGVLSLLKLNSVFNALYFVLFVLNSQLLGTCSRRKLQYPGRGGLSANDRRSPMGPRGQVGTWHYPVSYLVDA